MSGDHNMYASGNQPAFPRPGDFNPQMGMTLRDYFAAKAMQGFCTTLDEIVGEPFWNVLAGDAYKLADAMIQARGESK